MDLMIALTLTQVNLVTNVFALTIAAMGAAAAFFFLQRSEVAPRYRIVVSLVGIVCLIDAYNYYRMFEGWTAAYSVVDGTVRATGLQFNDSYRYAAWFLTVPILLIVLVLVMDLPPAQTRLRSIVLGLQAVEMIVLGYPGQLAADPGARWFWWACAMVPFLVIIYQLYIGLAQSIRNQPAEARGLVTTARLTTVLVWCIYPALYLLPMLELTGPLAFVGTQVGYAVADIIAKAVYGVLIYMVAVRKSEAAPVMAGPLPSQA